LKIIHSIFDFKPTEQTYITIGTFDGVHIGHQKIIEKLVAEAKKNSKKSVLLTFFPHPRMVLQKEASIKLLNTIDEKAALLEKTGLDYLIVLIGYDHHFGKNREGNIEQLTEYSHLYDFSVEEIPVQDIDEVAVSSTKIRRALANGDLKTANNYLGYYFSLSGRVIKGKQLGSKIGFPTANIELAEDYKLIPKTGVYVVKAIIDDVLIYGMMNIGTRPTVNGDYLSIETYFFNFDKNIYSQIITIELLYFIREEQKFDSVEKLKGQLKKDEKTSIEYIQNNL